MVIGKIPDDAWRSKLALCRMRIQGLGWLGRWNLAWYTYYWKIAEACKSMQITSNHQTIGRDYFASICTSSRLPVDILCQRGGFWNYSYRVTSSPNSAHFHDFWTFLDAWIFNATMLFTKRMLTVGYPHGIAYHFQQFNKWWWKNLCHTEPLLRWKSWWSLWGLACWATPCSPSPCHHAPKVGLDKQSIFIDRHFERPTMFSH